MKNDLTNTIASLKSLRDDIISLLRTYDNVEYAMPGNALRVNAKLKDGSQITIRINPGQPPKVARDGIEAQRGLNDTWPGDPYP